MNIPYPIIPTWGSIAIPNIWVVFTFFWLVLTVMCYFMIEKFCRIHEDPIPVHELVIASFFLWWILIPIWIHEYNQRIEDDLKKKRKKK